MTSAPFFRALLTDIWFWAGSLAALSAGVWVYHNHAKPPHPLEKVEACLFIVAEALAVERRATREVRLSCREEQTASSLSSNPCFSLRKSPPNASDCWPHYNCLFNRLTDLRDKYPSVKREKQRRTKERKRNQIAHNKRMKEDAEYRAFTNDIYESASVPVTARRIRITSNYGFEPNALWKSRFESAMAKQTKSDENQRILSNADACAGALQ